MNRKVLLQYAVIILLGVGLSFLIQEISYAQVVVDQRSMQQTYDPGDRLLENKWIYSWENPEKGEVVIFRQPDMKHRLIKRVVATANDIVDIKEGQLIVNGEVLKESYAIGLTKMKDLTMPYTVPEGEIFVVGDNREISVDSRSFGSIPIKDVEGKVVGRLWPLF